MFGYLVAIFLDKSFILFEYSIYIIAPTLQCCSSGGRKYSLRDAVNIVYFVLGLDLTPST